MNNNVFSSPWLQQVIVYCLIWFANLTGVCCFLTYTRGGVGGGCSCFFFFPRSCQPCPAVSVVHQKASGSVVPICSPQAAPAWATWELSSLSINLWLSLHWKRKRNKWLFTRKLLQQRKKIKDIIYCLLCIPNISCYVTVQIENTFSSRMILRIQFPHSLLPNPLTPAWEVEVHEQLTWPVFVDARAHIHPPTDTDRFPLHLVLCLFV